MGVEFVVKRNLRSCPSSETSGKRRHIVQEPLPRFAQRNHRRIRPQNLPYEVGKRHHRELLLRRAEAIEVIPGQGRQVGRVGNVQNVLGGSGIGGMP